MKTTNQIGLDRSKSVELSEKLNLLLADYQIFYINTRGFHWNIKGEKFFELHLKFEEIYTDALVKIDEIAERILTLGQRPLHSFTDYLKIAEIKEVTNVSDGREALSLVVKNMQQLLEIERVVLDLSAESGDEGTNALMSDYLREQEKSLWMFNAYLN